MLVKCLATGSTGNCYIVNVCDSCLILDAGVKIEQIVENVNLNNVSFCFISHEHKDHSLSRQKLEKRGVLILDGSVNREPIENLKFDKKQTDFRTWVIPIEHGKTACGALIAKHKRTNETFLYATDFSMCKYDLNAFEFDCVIVECNYCENLIKTKIDTLNEEESLKYKRQINTHMGLEGLQIFLNKLNLKKCKSIILVHKSKENIADTNQIGVVIHSKYKMPVAVCKTYGGMDWFI